MIVLTGRYPVDEADVCFFTDVEKSDASTLYPDNYVAVAAQQASPWARPRPPSTPTPTSPATR